MTQFSSSQEGGPGGSQPPSQTLSYGKQPKLCIRTRRPHGFYGNERRGGPSAFQAAGRAAELRKQERGKRLSPVPQTGARWRSPQRHGRGVAGSAAAQPTNSGAESEVGRTAARKRKSRRTPPPLTPAAPFLASQPVDRNFGGTARGGNIPIETEYIVSS